MPNFAIVVEGAHDASFLGQLLKARGFSFVNKLSLVPADWKILFPKTFPMDGETLERVMRFPEIFVQGTLAIGITTSGSDSRLISTLRAVVDAIGPSALSGVALFVDVDAHQATLRFSSIQNQIKVMNNAALAEGQPGYPVAVPRSPGVMEGSDPPIGVFLFPDNTQSGSLEDILIECAKINHPEIAKAAIDLVSHIDGMCPQDQADLKALRSGTGRTKAAVGTIANLVKPGVSVASSLAQTCWLDPPAFEHTFVIGAIAFLEALLENAVKNSNREVS